MIRRTFLTSMLSVAAITPAMALTSAQRAVVLSRSLDPATVTLISAMTVKPTQQRIALINHTIHSLKSAGLWSNLGLLYMLAAQNSQAAGLNWVSPSTAALVPTNSPIFATDRGYTGDGATSYLETGIVHSAVPNFAQNAAHAGAWNLTAGSGFTVGLSASSMVLLSSASTRAVRINSSTSLSTTGDPAIGHVVSVRRDSANLFSYRNGGAEISGASSSNALTASTVNILRSNTTFYSSQVACAHLGNQLSAAQVATLYAILQNYLHQVGAV